MRTNSLKAFINDQKILLLLIMICIGMFIKMPSFLGFENILNIFNRISIEGVMVIGMTYLIILGDIDLSVGAVMALSCTLSVIFQAYGVLPGVIAGILIGALIGLINGLIVVLLRAHSLAVTLGMFVLIRGVVYVIAKSLASAGGNYSLAGKNENFKYITETSILGVPSLIWILIILIIFFSFILTRTVYGRNIYATGGNRLASHYANIPVNLIRISVFVITGMLAGIAGVLLVSKYNIASYLLGDDTAIVVITAVMLGGVSLSGGEGSVLKAFQGLLLIGVIDNTMVQLRIYSSVKLMILGLLLIIILSFDGVYIRKAKYQ